MKIHENPFKSKVFLEIPAISKKLRFSRLDYIGKMWISNDFAKNFKKNQKNKNSILRFSKIWMDLYYSKQILDV